VKIALALTMFGLAVFQAQEARRPARLRGRMWRLTPRLILALGVVVFLLGAVLNGLFDVALGVVR
jgi:putative copper export protein